MAFKLEVLRGATVYNISADQPISIAGADGMGGAPVRNLEEQGPYQDGSSHLGERLEPRTITLRLNAVGSTAAALDGHRDTLNAMFKPVRGIPITLRITRDDGEIRQIDCRRTLLDLSLVKEDHPGHLHRAVVQLRAADPTFYGPTLEEEDFSAAPISWWLAYNTIGSANVLEHVESPTQGQLWANTGSVAANSSWTVAFRTQRSPTGNTMAFNVISPGFSDIDYVTLQQTTNGEVQKAGWGSARSSQNSFMTPGTANYFTGVRIVDATDGYGELYRDNTLVEQIGWSLPGFTPIPAAGSGTARWRSAATGTATQPWAQALSRAAVYNIALSSTQRAALNEAMTVSGSAFVSNIVYAGDFDSYPVLTLTGPISNPVITNLTTGDTLDFTGGTVGTAEIWTIDTRYGRKSVLNGTVNITSYLSNDSDLATFHIAPDPIAAGGTNTISIAYTAGGTAAAIRVAYYNRYLDY